MKKALSYLLIFIGIQLLGGAIIQTVWSLVTHSSDKTAAMLITLTAICAVLVIECGGVVGSAHPFHMDAGTDARTAQLDGERI